MTNYNQTRLDYYDRIQADTATCWQLMNGSLDQLIPLVWTKQERKWEETAAKFKEVVIALGEIYDEIEKRIGEPEVQPEWLKDTAPKVDYETVKRDLHNLIDVLDTESLDKMRVFVNGGIAKNG